MRKLRCLDLQCSSVTVVTIYWFLIYFCLDWLIGCLHRAGCLIKTRIRSRVIIWSLSRSLPNSSTRISNLYQSYLEDIREFAEFFNKDFKFVRVKEFAQFFSRVFKLKIVVEKKLMNIILLNNCWLFVVLLPHCMLGWSDLVLFFKLWRLCKAVN